MKKPRLIFTLVSSTFLFSTSAFCDLTFTQTTRGGGFDGDVKILISGDKVQLRSRVSGEFAAKHIQGAMIRNEKVYGKTVDLNEIEKNNAHPEGVQTAQVMRSDAHQGEVAKEVAKESVEIETARFDQGKYFKVNPEQLTYHETSIQEEHDKRTAKNKNGTQNMVLSSFKDTGKSEIIDGVKCKVFEGVLDAKGTPMFVDTIYVAPASAETVKQFWAAYTRFYKEVGMFTHNPMEVMFFKQDGYLDKLAALPGIPVKREIKNKMMSGGGSGGAMAGLPPGFKLPPGVSQEQIQAAMAGKMAAAGAAAGGGSGMGSAVIETKIVSTDAIDPQNFELPKGVTKKN